MAAASAERWRVFRGVFRFSIGILSVFRRMQEGRTAAPTSIGYWRYLKRALGLLGIKDVEEGYRVTTGHMERPWRAVGSMRDMRRPIA